MSNDKIHIKSNLCDYSVEFVSDFMQMLDSLDGNFVYVIDKNVYKIYENKFSSIALERVFFMDALEQKKNMDTVMEIIRFWSSLSMKKNWKVLCFGGGITQDVTTIASYLFLRNVEWYFFPTTLLSMCDSCIGGKCGINLGEYKNQIGVFYPPKKIFLDMKFLDTLTEDDYLNGWGEILKFSLTADPAFYDSLKKEKQYIPCLHIKDYVRWGLKVKRDIIEADEFELDYRRVLNYGHTFGHALEAYTYNIIPHGQGVIWGIDIANYLAWKENLISRDYYFDVKLTIRSCFLKEEVIVDKPMRLFEIIRRDKKVKDDTLFFSMLDGDSHLCVHPMKIDGRLETLYLDYLKETHEYYHN